jgi:hypothetical protein
LLHDGISSPITTVIGHPGLPRKQQVDRRIGITTCIFNAQRLPEIRYGAADGEIPLKIGLRAGDGTVKRDKQL